MFRRLISALVFLVTTVSSAGAAEPPIRWGADAAGGAPYIFPDPKNPGVNIGFEVDLAAALARELGRPVIHVQYEWPSLTSGIERNDLDIAMNGIENTPPRAERYRLTRPYFRYREQLVVRKTETRFTDVPSCKQVGCVVATLADTAAERLLDKEGMQKKIYDGQVEPFADLALGRVDAVLIDEPIVAFYGDSNPALKRTGEPVAPGDYVAVLRKSDEALAKQIDAAFERLAARGELERIYRKWNLWSDAQAALFHRMGEAAQIERADWSPAKYLPLLLNGALLTVFIACASMLLAVALGLPIALIRLFGPAPLRWSATVYVEFFRGIPVLLLLYFLYYGLPVLSETMHWPVKLALEPLTAAILGFGITYAAYESEIYRTGIRAVPQGQWDAARSLGMGRALTFRRIVMPQAARIILPPMTNDFVALFKDTSVVSVIAVVELTKQYQILSKSSFKYLEMGLATAALYLIMSVPLSRLAAHLEKKFSHYVH
jgi:polar amino acid transport system substrate-binding protein